MGLLGKNFNTGDAILGFFGADVRGIKEARRKREAAEAQAKIVEELIAQAQAAGATPADIAIIRANPEKYAEEAASRFRTRAISPNSEIVTPGFNGQRNVYRSAPAPTQMEGEFNFIDRLVNEGKIKPADARGWLQGQVNPVQWTRVEDPATGEIRLIPTPRNAPPGAAGTPSAGAGGPPASAPRVGATGASSVFNSIIQQESGGRPGVPGQMTPYGRPMGMTQMLPATAREMAGKLGLPFRPELLSGTTPEAAEYQRRLGEAYYQQGLAANGGDERAAAMYYHGGPNKRMWGPKTRRYADQVMARAGGSQPIPVRTKAQRDALPSGTLYTAPDGSVKRKR